MLADPRPLARAVGSGARVDRPRSATAAESPLAPLTLADDESPPRAADALEHPALPERVRQCRPGCPAVAVQEQRVEVHPQGERVGAAGPDRVAFAADLVLPGR